MTQLRDDKKALSDVLGEPGAIDLNTRDPLAEWFEENKHRVNQLLVLMLIVGLCYYGYNTFKGALRQRVADASDLFIKAREGFEAYEKERLNLANLEVSSEADKDKKIEESRKSLAQLQTKLNEILTGLRESQPPYSRFADLYQARIAASNQNTDLNLPNWSAEEVGTANRLLAEIQTLFVARQLLDNVDASKVNSARQALGELARNAEVVHANAAIVLARIASTEEERSDARALLELVKSKHPEQYDLIKPELARL